MITEDDLRRMGLQPGPDGSWAKNPKNVEFRSGRTEADRAMINSMRHSVSRHFDMEPPASGLSPLETRRLNFFDGKHRLVDLVGNLPKSILAAKNPSRPRQEWFDGTEPSHEYVVQLALSIYVQKYYPDAEFRVDAQGNNMSKVQAGKLRRVNKRKGWPDFELYERQGDHCGLFLELKTAKTKLFKRDGSWNGKVDTKTGISHLENQNICHLMLRERGWKGGFAKGIAHCIEAVDCYMSGDFDRLDEFILEY